MWLLASNEQRPGLLLYTLHGTGHPSPQQSYWAPNANVSEAGKLPGASVGRDAGTWRTGVPGRGGPPPLKALASFP